MPLDTAKPPPLQPLSAYDVSVERGCLSEFEMDEIALPADFAPIVAAAETLPDLLTSGRIRTILGRLPTPDLQTFLKEATDTQVRTAMVRYAFLVQAYVWGEPTPPRCLPANLAVPIVRLAETLDQAPLLPYSAYVLDNWARIDTSEPIALDNIRMVQNFLGGQDENWFVLIHVAIEHEAGEAWGLAADLVAASAADDGDAATTLLGRMDAAWDRINAVFDRMPERCDPYVYFQRVRPFIHGWKDNPALVDGLIYDGVAKYAGRPQAFRGQTGSQSSLVPAMDALFGVEHNDDPLRSFLVELHAYRPVLHRRLIDDLRQASNLRRFAIAQRDPALISAFNACVQQVARFRTRHLEYAASYINAQAASGRGNDTDVGTGGTPFMKYLKKHRDENRAQTI